MYLDTRFKTKLEKFIQSLDYVKTAANSYKAIL